MKISEHTVSEDFVRGHLGHVFLVEDDRSALSSMSRELSSEGYRVYPFESPELFLQFVTPVSPACVLLDMRMPNMLGLEVQKQLKSMDIAMPVVFMSGESTVEQAVSALESGAIQFLIKPFGRKPLLEAVSKAMAHDRSLQREMVHKRSQLERISKLAPREREVLDLLVAGYAHQEISDKMGISYGTAKQYKGNIFIKLNIQTMAELIELMRSVD